MALVTSYDPRVGGVIGVPSKRNVHQPYRQTLSFNFATARTAKGSDLNTADSWNIFNAPADTIVLGAAVEIVTAANTSAGAVTLDIGFDSGDTLVDGAVITTGTAAGFTGGGTNAVTFRGGTRAADEVTLKIATMSVSGSMTTGVVKVHIWLCELDDA